MDRRRANNRAEGGKGFEQLKPFRSEASDRGALVWFLAALGIALIASLPCCAPQPAHAAPSTINGTCYVECTNPEIDGPMGGNTFIVRFPQYGIETTGYCTSGPMYGTPLPGHYPFTGTRLGNGGYAIAVDCSGAGMYPNHYSPLGAQNVGEFTIYLHGSVELQKHGNPAYESTMPEASVEGARYQLVAADGSACASLTTDAKGKATAADVPLGRYRLVETAASPGYALDESDQTIVVEGGKTSYANSWEPPLTGSIGVQKTSSTPAVTNEKPCYSLSNAVYGVYDDAACTNQVQLIVTDANGYGQSEATLWPGSYWVKEVSAPKGYALDTRSHPVALSVQSCLEGKAPLARVVDEPQLALAEPVALKIDAESGISQAQGDATLAGAVFQVEHFAGTFATPEEAAASGLLPTLTLTAVTDEQGVARIDPALLPSNGAGSGLPLGSGRDPEDPLVVAIENKPQTACLTLRKTDAATGLPLAQRGISWEMRAARDVVSADGTTRASQGETVATLTSDDSGSARATGLYLGAYEIIETQAPPGYVRATEPLRVELVYGDPSQPSIHAEAEFPNRPAQGCITVAKTDATSKEPLPEALYEIRATHDVVATDGSVLLQADDVAATLLTDDAGTATTGPLPLGRYEAVEIKAPEGYQLDGTEHPVELACQDQETPLVQARLNLANNPLPSAQPEPAIAKTGDSARSAEFSLVGIIAAAALLAVASLERTARHSARTGRRRT